MGEVEQDEPQPRGRAACRKHNPGTKSVCEIASQRSLQASLKPAQHLGQRYSGNSDP